MQGCRLPALVLIAVLAPGAALAVTRDELIDQIETTYTSSAVIPADSPVVDLMLTQAKAANPDAAAETWQAVRGELAAAFSKSFTARGGMLDTLIRESLQPLSDRELRSLSQILRDPAYRKFQAAMSSSAAQGQMTRSMMQVGLQLGTLINGVLASHQLKEVH